MLVGFTAGWRFGAVTTNRPPRSPSAAPWYRPSRDRKPHHGQEDASDPTAADRFHRRAVLAALRRLAEPCGVRGVQRGLGRTPSTCVLLDVVRPRRRSAAAPAPRR